MLPSWRHMPLVEWWQKPQGSRVQTRHMLQIVRHQKLSPRYPHICLLTSKQFGIKGLRIEFIYWIWRNETLWAWKLNNLRLPEDNNIKRIKLLLYHTCICWLKYFLYFFLIETLRKYITLIIEGLIFPNKLVWTILFFFLFMIFIFKIRNIYIF